MPIYMRQQFQKTHFNQTLWKNFSFSNKCKPKQSFSSVYENVGCGYFLKCIFIKKCIKIIFFFKKNLFLISSHQNDHKTPKKY
jgi:hypothetical protein